MDFILPNTFDAVERALDAALEKVERALERVLETLERALERVRDPQFLALDAALEKVERALEMVLETLERALEIVRDPQSLALDAALRARDPISRALVENLESTLDPQFRAVAACFPTLEESFLPRLLTCFSASWRRSPSQSRAFPVHWRVFFHTFGAVRLTSPITSLPASLTSPMSSFPCLSASFAVPQGLNVPATFPPPPAPTYALAPAAYLTRHPCIPAVNDAEPPIPAPTLPGDIIKSWEKKKKNKKNHHQHTHTHTPVAATLPTPLTPIFSLTAALAPAKAPTEFLVYRSPSRKLIMFEL